MAEPPDSYIIGLFFNTHSGARAQLGTRSPKTTPGEYGFRARRKRRAQNDTEAPIDSMQPIGVAEFPVPPNKPCSGVKNSLLGKEICNALEMLRELTPGGAEMAGNLKKFPAKFAAGRELTELER